MQSAITYIHLAFPVIIWEHGFASSTCVLWQAASPKCYLFEIDSSEKKHLSQVCEIKHLHAVNSFIFQGNIKSWSLFQVM